MGVTTAYKRELMTLTEDLPEKDVKQVLDFAHFLKAKKEGFSFAEIKTALSISGCLEQKKARGSNPQENLLMS